MAVAVAMLARGALVTRTSVAGPFSSRWGCGRQAVLLAQGLVAREDVAYATANPNDGSCSSTACARRSRCPRKKMTPQRPSRGGVVASVPAARPYGERSGWSRFGRVPRRGLK